MSPVPVSVADCPSSAVSLPDFYLQKLQTARLQCPYAEVDGIWWKAVLVELESRSVLAL